VNNFFPRSRLIILGVAGVIMAGYVIASYAKLAFAGGIAEPSRAAEPAERGQIVDRNGKPLAVPTFFYHLAVTPSAVGDADKAAAVLAPIAGLSPAAVKAQISGAKHNFLYLKKKLSEAEHEAAQRAIRAAKLSGVFFDRIPGRIYPENALASQLIGYMGDAGQGLSGVEYALQDALSPHRSGDSGTAVHGSNVYLTIDASLQYKLEGVARKALKDTRAESMMLLAADAKTGELLSYISLPSADLNKYPQAGDAERLNRPAVTAYEPGSVFKIFSVAAFLEAGAIREDDTFYCDGKYERQLPNGQTIRIGCLGRHGNITARDALKYSCNVALARMSERIDAERFLALLRALGFGNKTGVELPGETRGMVRTPKDALWTARSKPTISIGQEIGVSALQMVEAATVLTNGGVPMPLSVISRVTDRVGKVLPQREAERRERVLSEETARAVLSYMETVAASGTGTRAALRDVSVGVKTGTAQMRDEKRGGYSQTDFVSNCIAVFPAEDPKIILYIVIAKAKGETYAGRIVAPVVAEAASMIIDHMGFARAGAASFSHSGVISVPEMPEVSVGAVLPDFTGTPKRLLVPLLARDDLRILIEGEGYVISQMPPPGTPVTADMALEFRLGWED
jgi:cell division protein FtsI (penicillin-binding protein 3)